MMSQRFSQSSWSKVFAWLLVVVIVAMTSLQPAAPQAVAEEVLASTPTPTANNPFRAEHDDQEVPPASMITEVGEPPEEGPPATPPIVVKPGDIAPSPMEGEQCYYTGTMPVPGGWGWEFVYAPSYGAYFNQGTIPPGSVPDLGGYMKMWETFNPGGITTALGIEAEVASRGLWNPNRTFRWQVPGGVATVGEEIVGEEWQTKLFFTRENLRAYPVDARILAQRGSADTAWVRSLRVIRCIAVGSTPTPTSTPTRTPQPTVTPTRTPCPTLPPQPTSTPTPSGGLGVVIPGDGCLRQVSLPLITMGSGDTCPRAPLPSIAEDTSAMSIPACFPLDPRIAATIREACGGSYQIDWMVSNGQQVVGQRVTCTGRSQGSPENLALFMQAVPVISLGGFLAIALPVGAAVVGGILVGGTIYLIVSYNGDPGVDWISAPSEWMANEWAMGAMDPPSGLVLPLGVRRGPVQSAGAPVGVKIYDGGWNGLNTRQMWIIDPASRPSGAGASALVQILQPDSLWSVLLVPSIQPSDRVLAGPVGLAYPEDGANVLTNDIGDNSMLSNLHAESRHILQSINTGGLVQSRGNPDDPDSILVYGGVDPVRRIGRVAVLWRDGWKSAYVLFEFGVQPNPGQGLFQLGTTGWWYSRWGVRSVCSWYFAYLQGREEFPEWALLPSHLGKARFFEIVGKYNLSRIAELHLPI